MPRAKKVASTPEKQKFEHDLFAQIGTVWEATVEDWDFKPEPFVEWLIEVLMMGESITIRPGQGGKSIGIQIWTWENKRPYVWCNETEEVDQYVSDLLERIAASKAQKS